MAQQVSSRDDRLVANQQTFRQANRGMVEAVNVDAATHVPFLCEFADLDCLGRVEASLLTVHEMRSAALNGARR